jgi:phosphoribosylanthranilate isomerase
MTFKYMTVTGADDDTNIRGMIELSKEYNFLEWGLLFPLLGHPRFPSLEWFKKLKEEVKQKDVKLNLSAHLCFDMLDSALANKLAEDYLKGFNRVQLNFHGIDHFWLKDELEPLFKFIETNANRKIIFQFDGVNDKWILEYLDINKYPNIQYLFDTSSGAGILPNTFPMPYSGVTCGFAGGLGPDNLKDVVTTFKETLNPTKSFWIDMETRVRTKGKFDLNKVAQCAEIVAKTVWGRHPI